MQLTKSKTDNYSSYYYKWTKNSGPIVQILENCSDGTKRIYTSEDV